MVSQPAPLASTEVSPEWSQSWASMGAPSPSPWPGVDNEPASGGNVCPVGGYIDRLPSICGSLCFSQPVVSDDLSFFSFSLSLFARANPN